ncbi:MAG: DNA topoisomerase IV subunit A [Alphaproteobacteria bacterium]|nr:DNA topoisomerase IV subunit A [Alphaproteobacteria bacterium]
MSKIQEVQIDKALSERYLAYALSTIVSRSLPDVRDGLKPVHRRLLFAMRQLKLDPKGGFKKCARVVGDVIGKYHPHGDASVYEAMVRLAQSFAVRYPLVEGQGNFGNIDGDKAAAMRYTEARLTPVAMALMQGLESNAVDFALTYDGQEEEPLLMPASFPNLLANGSSGIAVGMATNIPPHNLSELCDALKYLIKHPEASVSDLAKYIQGPDFPTGGILINSKDSIIKTYEKGRGVFRVRAKYEVEELSHGQYQIIITEIPYQVSKSDLITRIAKLILDKKIPLLSDVRDESDENIRIVLEPKNRTVDAKVLMAYLFQQTDLQINFNLNMNVIDKEGTPQVMSLKEVLKAFLDHCFVLLKRKSLYRLDKIEHRMEVLKGYIIAYLNLDRVIEIIRTQDEPKPFLMKEFSLTDIQAEAILNMKLRSLRKLEEMELKNEHKALEEEKNCLQKLLETPDLMWQNIALQFNEVKKLAPANSSLGARRTQVLETEFKPIEVPLEVLIEKEPITVILSEKGWIKTIKGHNDDPESLKFKEGDELQCSLKAQTTDKIVFYGDNGVFYTVMADKIPSGRGYGEPVRLSMDLPEEVNILKMFIYEDDKVFFVASEKGKGFCVNSNDILAQTRVGKKILNLKKGDKAFKILEADGDTVAVIGQNRKMLIFGLDEVPTLSRGQGVILQKYKDGKLSDVKIFKKEEGLSFPFGNGTRIERDLTMWEGRRASVGKIPPVGFPRSNKFS